MNQAKRFGNSSASETEANAQEHITTSRAAPFIVQVSAPEPRHWFYAPSDQLFKNFVGSAKRQHMPQIPIYLASLHPPRYSDVIPDQVFTPVVSALLPKPISPIFSVPAVLPDSRKGWHLLLLICRGLSTVPAAWWGIRCALTFLRELLLDGEALWFGGVPWDAEKRFRVTEVFLAILWVNSHLINPCIKTYG